MADADARELDRRLLHLELVVARLSEQVKQLTEDRAYLEWKAQRDVERLRMYQPRQDGGVIPPP